MSRAIARFLVEVRVLRPLNVKEDGLMTLTDAAKWLGLSTSAMGYLVYRGVPRRVVDQEEPNPTKANRVLVEDVERELARRRQRRGDARLKHRRDRSAVAA